MQHAKVVLCLDIAKLSQGQPFFVGCAVISLEIGLVTATQNGPGWHACHQVLSNASENMYMKWILITLSTICIAMVG
jgi:hypothetical protein